MRIVVSLLCPYVPSNFFDMHMKNISLACLLSLLLLPVMAYADEPADAHAQARAERRAAVAFSKRYKKLGLERAYQLQKAYVRNQLTHDVRVVGFKAGLTSAGAPAKAGLNAPITGVLLEPAVDADRAVIRLADAWGLLLEAEMAFRVSTLISQPLDINQLKQHVDAVAPAIELPDLSFEDTGFNGLDIIANNAMAYLFVLGDWQPLQQFGDVDDVSVRLQCADELVAEGESAGVYGGQWKALLWMVNQLVQQGYTIQPGQVLLTGAMTPMIKASACAYQADFGRLGRIRLVVTE